MGVPSAPPPPIGSVGLGELFVDAQTRCIWLGVSAAINPQQAILVGDIIGLQQAISESAVAVTAQTDTKLATKANTVHTHTISDITGLSAQLAALGNQMPVGAIIMWSGILADIPTGWALCNGQNGTPDLRERFVIGAGGAITALSVGGANTKTVNTQTGGAHGHTLTIDNHVLTVAEIPAHGHGVTDPGHNHAITDPGHKHTAAKANNIAGAAGSDNGIYGSPWYGGQFQADTSTATTGITIQNKVTGITIQNSGGGTGHNHTGSANNGGEHSHSLNIDVRPAYICLGYIMKLA